MHQHQQQQAKYMSLPISDKTGIQMHFNTASKVCQRFVAVLAALTIPSSLNLAPQVLHGSIWLRKCYSANRTQHCTIDWKHSWSAHILPSTLIRYSLCRTAAIYSIALQEALHYTHTHLTPRFKHAIISDKMSTDMLATGYECNLSGACSAHGSWCSTACNDGLPVLNAAMRKPACRRALVKGP